MAIDNKVRYGDTLRMDWKQLIADITASGLTQAEIASRSGLAQSAISELATGKTVEPRYSTAKKLIAIRNTLAKKRKQEA